MIRRVLEIPDPGLREPCAPVTEITPETARLAGDMFDTMHANAGVGLAAPQIGVHTRLFVLELPSDDDDPLSGRQFVLINPEVELNGARKEMVEGCLSLPGFRAFVERAEGVTVAFTQLDGARVSLDARGLFAQAVQHEVDHLNGVLFIDHLKSLLDLEKIPPEMLDWTEEAEAEAA
ncbi:MAG: peptide deformylase [Chloroflexota bacterium]|nr:peptide deformylase [Chloroflexota bacterium]